jgi:hypothetical protein
MFTVMVAVYEDGSFYTEVQKDGVMPATNEQWFEWVDEAKFTIEANFEHIPEENYLDDPIEVCHFWVTEGVGAMVAVKQGRLKIEWTPDED